MSNEELEGRVAALEVIAMTALGFCVANTRNDPDYWKAGVILGNMRDALKTQAACSSLKPAITQLAMAAVSWTWWRRITAAKLIALWAGRVGLVDCGMRPLEISFTPPNVRGGCCAKA